jgi:hypothetical protein
MEIKSCPYCGEPLHDYWGVLRCQHCRRWITEEELALCERAQLDSVVMVSPLSKGDRVHPEDTCTESQCQVAATGGGRRGRTESDAR